MPHINSINFYQNRPKIKLFLPKKFFFERWGIRPPHPMPPVAGGLAPTPIASGGWRIRPQTPQRPPFRRFLATGLHEEKFTSRYCRPPFTSSFGFKYAWNVWRRRCSHSQTMYNTAKSISPRNTYIKKLSQKILSPAPTPLWLWLR